MINWNIMKAQYEIWKLIHKNIVSWYYMNVKVKGIDNFGIRYFSTLQH